MVKEYKISEDEMYVFVNLISYALNNMDETESRAILGKSMQNLDQMGKKLDVRVPENRKNSGYSR